jgi:hypothetical protein
MKHKIPQMFVKFCGTGTECSGDFICRTKLFFDNRIQVVNSPDKVFRWRKWLYGFVLAFHNGIGIWAKN